MSPVSPLALLSQWEGGFFMLVSGKHQDETELKIKSVIWKINIGGVSSCGLRYKLRFIKTIP